MATPIVLRVLEGHARAYRHTWRGTTIGALARPTLFLAAIGVGLGRLVDTGAGGAQLPGADSFLAWFAPGLLAASLMQAGASDGMFPVMAGRRWVGTYYAAVASPVRPRDLYLGNLLWSATRIAAIGAVFVVVAALFGAVPVGRGALALFPAALTGVVTCAAMSAFVVTRDSPQILAGMNRFLIVPLFLFSGTFFPVDQLPEVVAPVVHVIPVWHGVELTRALALGSDPTLAWPVHVAVLIAVGAIALLAGTTTFSRVLRR